MLVSTPLAWDQLLKLIRRPHAETELKVYTGVSGEQGIWV